MPPLSKQKRKLKGQQRTADGKYNKKARTIDQDLLAPDYDEYDAIITSHDDNGSSNSPSNNPYNDPDSFGGNTDSNINDVSAGDVAYVDFEFFSEEEWGDD